MEKKILVGSIIAVIILVLVSFTGVVGYQTTKSSHIARASPLFSVRSKRAIDEESKEFTFDYVGKGEDIAIPISKRNESNKLIFKVFERLSKMDKGEQKEVMESIIKLLQKINYLNDKRLVEFEQLYYEIKNNIVEAYETPTQISDGFTIDGGSVFCYLLAFLLITPFMIMYVALLILLSIFIILYLIWDTSMGETCEGWCITMYC